MKLLIGLDGSTDTERIKAKAGAARLRALDEATNSQGLRCCRSGTRAVCWLSDEITLKASGGR